MFHGLSKTPEYSVWAQIKQRCLNPRSSGYKHYGGRGIRLCWRWQSFVGFYADMGSRPAPDYVVHRLDADGDYEPGNCVWAPRPQRVKEKDPHRALDRVERWQVLNPDAYKAMVEVGLALRSGTLIRPDYCQRCGTPTRVVAQHRDYRRPLDVVWVCYFCRYQRQQGTLGEPIPLHRQPRHAPPSPRPGPKIARLCASGTADGRPCSLRGRYQGYDGRFYCGQHLIRAQRR